MKYQVEIREILSRIVSAEANSFDEAVEIIKGQYKEQKLVLTSEDFINVGFIKHDEKKQRVTDDGLPF